MKFKLMSLGLGIALSLGILLFMATLVEPPGGETATTEQKSIVINMQNEVTQVQVRERQVQPLLTPPVAVARVPQLPATTSPSQVAAMRSWTALCIGVDQNCAGAADSSI